MKTIILTDEQAAMLNLAWEHVVEVTDSLEAVMVDQYTHMNPDASPERVEA